MKVVLLIPFLLFSVITFSQDLVATGYNGPTSFRQYEVLRGTVTISNLGIVKTRATRCYVYLSEDKNPKNSGSFFSIPALEPGDSFIGTLSGDAYVSPGSYYLIIVADGHDLIIETDETNNSQVIPIIVEEPDVDFTFSSFSLDKTSYSPYDRIIPSYFVKILGNTSIGGLINIEFVVSSDQVRSTDDKLLTQIPHNLFGSDNFQSFPTQTPILPKLDNGNYFLIAKIDFDNRYKETNEGNNEWIVPITITTPSIDLTITEVSELSYFQGYISATVKVKNQGSTGVGRYTMSPKLIGPDGSVVFSTMSDLGSYLAPGEEKSHKIMHEVFLLKPGTHYAQFVINENGAIIETNLANNTYTAYSQPIEIQIPQFKSATLNRLEVSGTIDNTDTQVEIKLDITNSGTFHSFSHSIQVIIKDQNQTTIHSSWEMLYIDIYPGWTDRRTLTLNLTNPLAVGNYQVSVNCTNECNVAPSLQPLNFQVVPAPYTLTGSVLGEDGQVFNKGKLFLYEKNGATISIVQKKEINEVSSFSFKLVPNRYTLYFIPDHKENPDYVPTIFGKTVTLDNNNFFDLSGDKQINFEILRVNAKPEGDGIISGNISFEGNFSDATTRQLSYESAGNIPIILLTNDGEIVGVTHTDENGRYEFSKLPRNVYSVLPSLEPDNPILPNQVAVDLTAGNKTINFVITPDHITSDINAYLLPQAVAFDPFEAKQFGDDPFPLFAHSDSGLPIKYSSSDNSVATIDNDEVVIHGVGSVVITATQGGNAFYEPAETSRTLVIQKADQRIKFSAIPLKVYGDGPFFVPSASSAGLPVEISSSNPEIASIIENVIFLHKAGTVKLVAKQDGNHLYNPATPVQQTLVIDKASQTISFESLADQTLDKEFLHLSATASSTLDVEFVSSDEEVVSINGGIATIHKDGIVAITASQKGNDNFYAADDVVRTLIIHNILGIEQQDFSKEIYPNPTSNFLFVSIPNASEVEVFDVMGRPRKELKLIDGRIDFSYSEKGLYFMKIFLETKTILTRVIRK